MRQMRVYGLNVESGEGIPTTYLPICIPHFQPVWPDLAKFYQIGKTFKVFGKNWLRVNFLLGKN